MSEWIDVPVAEVAVGDSVKIKGYGRRHDSAFTFGGHESYPVVSVAGDDVTVDWMQGIPAPERYVSIVRSSIVAARRRKPEPAPKPGDWRHGAPQIPNVAHTPDGCYSVPAVPQGSEPPIDWPEAEKVFCQMQSGYTYIGKGPEGYLQNAARAYLALKAERDALRDRLTTAEKCVSAAKSVIDGMEREIGGAHVDIIQKVAENAALKARVEELSEKLLWATSSYEERVVILARREKRKEQEASNGK